MKSKSSSKGEKLQRVQAPCSFFFYQYHVNFNASTSRRTIFLIRYLSCYNEIPYFFLENGIKELIQGREMMTMYMLLSRFFPLWINIIFTYWAISALRPMILLIRYLSGILWDLKELTQKEKGRVQTLHVHVVTEQTEIYCTLCYKHNI